MSRKVKKPASRGKKIVRWVGGVAAASLLITAGVGGWLVWDFNNRLQDNSVDIGEPPAEPQKLEPQVTVDEFQGAFTMLLVGSDDGNGDLKYGKRDIALNDVNILLHVSADHTKATAISVPRDLFVDIPECTNPDTGVTSRAVSGIKINQAFSRGGLKCVVDTFRDLTGQPIPYAATIQFNGVVEMSTAVGGVPVCVSADINDPHSGLNLTAGEHALEGDEALAFLRTRHGVADGSDLGRISNQQVFLSSLMRTLKNSDTLSDPKKVYDIAQVVADNMSLSTSLASVSTLASLGYTLKDVPLANITFLQYPTTLEFVGGVEGLTSNETSADEMLEAVFADQQVNITGGTGRVGSIDNSPNPSTSEEPQPESTATPEPTSSPDMTVTPEPSPTVDLPEDVTGQTAEQNTCSRGAGDY